MDSPAEFSVETTRDGGAAVLRGDWTAVNLGDAGARLREALREAKAPKLDLSAIGRCDTAGAYAIVRATDGNFEAASLTAPPPVARLLTLVSHASRAAPVPHRRHRSFYDLLVRIGRGLTNALSDGYETIAFFGHLMVAVGHAIADPRRLRWAAIVSLAERAGLDAIPIVAITTFFIGAVVGFLGADELAQFGAQVFAVELIGIAVMREFNIVITAVLLAGRSASSFAAEIGAMKMNQEIDAMRIMGVDPFEALVLPRFLAMLLTIPLLTFVATLAGLTGGLLVSWVVLDLSPSFFLERMVESVGATHFWIGMSKAPVMAVVIAGIGCRQGLEVGGDVDSLGRRVTAAVVHSIFSIILIDAVFALVYMKLNV
ncbi:MAG TPA: ABC transporter permease [Caulobacteraceae bacterium]|nr:ABC transporter permease [Caulobacteraceae bacterium]